MVVISTLFNNTQILYVLQDGEAKEVNYAALDLPTIKVKRGNKMKRENTQCVYSIVRSDYHNQQHPSL